MRLYRGGQQDATHVPMVLLDTSVPLTSHRPLCRSSSCYLLHYRTWRESTSSRCGMRIWQRRNTGSQRLRRPLLTPSAIREQAKRRQPGAEAQQAGL
jgi:hypothetical protein